MSSAKAWVSAFRLRTLPLALSSIIMGSFLAAKDGSFKLLICLLAILTTIFLQILSNLANDYGDSQNGADSVFRKGPQRAVQSGKISPEAMKKGMYLFGGLSLVTGIILLVNAISFSAFGTFGFFLILGILSIVAAIKYTAGKNPYGYAGLGDISVFLFFGLVGVGGCYYLHTHTLDYKILLPAFACGFFSAAVLNINNIRDIESDKLAGKYSIPVRLGKGKAKIYHWFLLIGGFGSAFTYILLNENHSAGKWLFLLSFPLILITGIKVTKENESEKIDPQLKLMALSTLAFVILFGLGLLLS